MSTRNLYELCLGNQSAVEFCETILRLTAVYDDLIDKDKPVPDSEVHAMMWAALITLPRNAFYCQHFAVLNPLVAQAILNWRAANGLEEVGRDDDFNIAFIIRSSYCDILCAVMLILGGPDYAVAGAQEIRRHFHKETFSAYLEEKLKGNTHVQQ